MNIKIKVIRIRCAKDFSVDSKQKVGEVWL
jgi:hypothetical protein